MVLPRAAWPRSTTTEFHCAAYRILPAPWPLGEALVWWLSVLNAIACTFAPVLMVMMAIERMGAGIAAQTGMVGPMSTILMGVLILDEPLTGWVVAGTVLVLGGVWLLARQRR